MLAFQGMPQMQVSISIGVQPQTVQPKSKREHFSEISVQYIMKIMEVNLSEWRTSLVFAI